MGRVMMIQYFNTGHASKLTFIGFVLLTAMLLVHKHLAHRQFLRKFHGRAASESVCIDLLTAQRTVMQRHSADKSDHSATIQLDYVCEIHCKP